MHIQNKGKHYHSLSMGKQDSRIHELLSPIINTVRSNKINSFFQLRTKLHEQPPPSFIFEPYAATPLNSQAKMYATHGPSRSPRNNPQMSPRTAGSPTRAYNPDRKDIKPPTSHSHNKAKLFRINSKIKKHLVEQINFDEIEKMLYKKRDCVTQYEHYLKAKTQKSKKAKHPRKKQISPEPQEKATIKKQPTPDENDNKNQQMFYQTMPVRTAAKKRFWLKDKSRRDRTAAQGWLSAVEGRSFATVQH